MSHKVIAIVNEGNFEPEPISKIRLQTAIIVRDTLNPSAGFRTDSNVYVNGTETPNQLNTLILAQIKTDLLALGVHSLADQDILVTKFV